MGEHGCTRPIICGFQKKLASCSGAPFHCVTPCDMNTWPSAIEVKLQAKLFEKYMWFVHKFAIFSINGNRKSTEEAVFVKASQQFLIVFLPKSLWFNLQFHDSPGDITTRDIHWIVTRFSPPKHLRIFVRVSWDDNDFCHDFNDLH